MGDGLGLPTLVDLDHDGRRELLSRDKRFHCAFGLCAAPRPIQIWTLRRGRFRDVTRRYRQVVERHATEIWRGYVRYRDNNHDVGRGELPAWAAEEYLLGRGSLVQARLQEARGKGYLADTDPNAVAFIRALNAFLQESGYKSD